MEIANVHRAHFDPLAGIVKKKAEPVDPAVLAQFASREFMKTQSLRANLLGSVSSIAMVSAVFGQSYQ